MVLLIKNKLASFEDVAHLSNLAGEVHGKLPAELGGQNLRNAGVPKAKSMPHLNLPAELGGQDLRNAGAPKEKSMSHLNLPAKLGGQFLRSGGVPKEKSMSYLNLPAKLGGQNLRNAGVPKAKSMPRLNILAEGGSLRAHCSAVLNAEFQGLKPGSLFARKVKSAKDDLKHLFDHAPQEHRVKPGGPAGPVSVELACSTAVSDATATPSLDPPSSPPSSPTFAIPTLFDDEYEAHLHSLTATARGWLAFKRLFPTRRALSDPTVEEARHDFCQALIQSFPDHLSSAPSPQLPPSSGDSLDPMRLLDPASPISPLVSLGSVGDKSPEFSDEELQREFDSFSFHSSQEEDWTSEVESRKQNAFNKTLSEMKRELAIPIPKLSSYFSDDSLAESAAQSVQIKTRMPCSSAHSEISDESSIYSADEEDELDEDEASIAVSPPGSPARSDAVATFVPSAPELLLFDAPAEHDVTTPSIAQVEDEIDDVWKALAMHVPRLLTSISEESLADEYEIEATGQAPPPLSFQRPLSEFRKRLRFTRRFASLPDYMDSTPVARGTEPSDVEISIATTTTTDIPPESPEVSFQSNRTLRRVRKFADLKNLVILPTTQCTSSTETLCDTISLYEEASFSEAQPRRLRRAPRYLDLRKAFCGTNHTQISSSLQGRHSFDNERSFENVHSFKNTHSLYDAHSFTSLHSFTNLKSHCSFEEKYPPADTEGNPAILRCDVPLSKPELPPKPSGLLLRWKRSQLSPVTTQEPSSVCTHCDLASSLPLYSCAKITRSRAKHSRAPNVSRKSLRKRLDATCIEPETVHGHSPIKSQNIPSVGEIGKGKMLAKLFSARRFK